MSNSKTSLFSNIKSDLPASIVVFLVALPLCLGIALASDAPPFSGIIAGIIGGIVVGSLSGSPLGVSGPAAGLAVIVATSIKDLGSFDIFLVAVVIGGAIQMILGFLRGGVIGYYFPSAVIKGMLSGIGIVIIRKQIPYAFGTVNAPEVDFEFSFRNLGSELMEIINHFDHVHAGSTVITLVSLGILILWERPFMKKLAFTKIIQGPLVAVVSGIILYLTFQSIPSLALPAGQLVSIPSFESFEGLRAMFTVPDFTGINNDVLIVAVTIAVVASLETLLSVEATDKLDPQKRVTPTNRELIAQGAGNMVSGLIGGLPITQVIVRSSTNVQSGGKTKLSAIIHGIILAICVFTIPNVLNLIPYATLAAVLFVVGYKLAKPALFRQIFRFGYSQFIPFIATILGIVFTDLLIGIGLGLVIGIFQIIWRNYQLPYELKKGDKENVSKITLSENVSFLNKVRILKTLEELPKDSKMIIDAQKTRYIHADVIEIIEDFQKTSELKGINLEVLGLSEEEKKIKLI